MRLTAIALTILILSTAGTARAHTATSDLTGSGAQYNPTGIYAAVNGAYVWKLTINATSQVFDGWIDRYGFGYDGTPMLNRERISGQFGGSAINIQLPDNKFSDGLWAGTIEQGGFVFRTSQRGEYVDLSFSPSGDESVAELVQWNSNKIGGDERTQEQHDAEQDRADQLNQASQDVAAATEALKRAKGDEGLRKREDDRLLVIVKKSQSALDAVQADYNATHNGTIFAFFWKLFHPRIDGIQESRLLAAQASRDRAQAAWEPADAAYHASQGVVNDAVSKLDNAESALNELAQN